MTDREFTVEEAEALLPRLSESLEAIRRARQVVLSGAQHVKRSSRWNGGGRPGREYWDAMHVLRRQVEAVTEEGIILRDADSGLVDFPSRREGDAIFLCWRLGEERVAFWHGPGSGFGGRRPL